MRRLSIIDPDNGSQPMGRDGVWLVYNGETYNFGELRRQDYRYETRSDTEVVLSLYLRDGDAFVHQLRGMFALALYDERRQRLLLARDPMGVKPLFYAFHEGRLHFASEIKALLEAGLPRRLNHGGLYQQLSFLYVPPPETMFEGIYQLPAGHLLTWEKGRVEVRRYWDQPCPTPGGGLWEHLLETVQAHLVADTPIGVFLSGGLDSSAMALAVKELGYPLRTFTIGFRQAGLYDESAHARRVATYLGADHHEEVVEPESVLELPAIVQALDEPMADASVLPNYRLARLASRMVKVALSGTGGDELLGGYRRYQAQRWPRPAWLKSLVDRLPAGSATSAGNWVRLAQKLAHGRLLACDQGLDEDQKLALLRSIRFDWPPSSTLCQASTPEAAMLSDLRTYLPGDLLTLTDRMSMAHSLEVRVPFVDVRFADYAASLSIRDKVGFWQTKVAFRKALRGRLPHEILQRPKQGFGVPVDLWLRRELRTLADRLLSPEATRARGLFREREVTRLYQSHLHGQDRSAQLWPLLMVELWHRLYLDQAPSQKRRSLAEVL